MAIEWAEGDSEERVGQGVGEPVDIRDFIGMPNIADELGEEQLNRIGQKAFQKYQLDKETRSDWEDKIEKAMEMALQITQKKSYPWPDAANVKYPILTTAALQFASRAYPAIVDGRNVVKGKVIGNDDGQEPSQENPEGVQPGAKQKRADRVARHMSYQLIEEMEEWEEGTDQLLHILPIVGLVFRKVYYDTRLKRNVSEMVSAKHLIVNDNVKTLETAPAITEEFQLYPHEIEERKRFGLYLDVDFGQPTAQIDTKQGDPAPSVGDEDAPHVFLEQHRYLDLDDDGYSEPYIVTLHKDSQRVVRIVARFDMEGIETEGERIIRIEPVHYYIKYRFIPSPDGSFYDLGFGLLLGPLNSVVNTTLNQLLDAGTLQNMGGGFIGSDLRMKSGPLRFTPGEYKRVQSMGGKIRDSIVPLTMAGPSPVLFQLLGLLIDAAKDVASVKDVLTGDQDASNASPTTTLALIEQGLKVFTAIYKRVHRSLKKELKMLYRLNRLRLPEEAYFNLLDTPEAISFKDYEDESIDIMPVSDPSVVTDTQRLGRAEFLMTFMGNPMMDPQEILRRVLAAASIEDPDKLFAKDQGPSHEQIVAEMEVKLREREVVVKERELEAKIPKFAAEAIFNLAKAEGVEPGQQLQLLKQQFDMLVAEDNIKMKLKEQENAANAGGNGGVAPTPGNQAGPPVS